MIYASTEKISAALLQGENPLPHFRSREHDMRVEFCKGTPPFCLSGAGFSCGYRILPYTVQDRYDRNRKECDIRTIVMENDFIKAEFLPDWGGRLWSLVDKTEGRELLYKNGVLQPANLAIRNAWFSGGIEWNVGQYGHAFTTCSTVGFASVRASDGEEFLRMYSYERCKDFFWQIDFHLPSSSHFLYAHPVIFNINDEPLSVYYWTNIAVPQTESSRVFASSRHALYKTPDDQNGRPTFGYGSMPFFPIAPDIDLSYPARIPFSSEYFFNCTDESHPWEAALEKDGSGLFDVSTGELSYRKMFCWGNCRGGRHWGSFLAGEAETSLGAREGEEETADCRYFEIQAGLSQTQLHGVSMPPRDRWEWTQAFGLLCVSASDAASNDWNLAASAVERSVRDSIDTSKLDLLDASYAAEADLPISKTLSDAGEWGALEKERRMMRGESDIPPSAAFCFSDEQNPWRLLLTKGIFPYRSPEDGPGQFMTGRKWQRLLEAYIAASKEMPPWNAFYHLGVMKMENGDEEGAASCWLDAEKACSTAWTQRNLAQLALFKNDITGALSHYECAVQAAGFYADVSVAEEYAALLVQTERYEKAIELYSSLPDAWKNSDSLVIAYGRACASLGKKDEAYKTLSRNFANIRESESPLADIWSRMHASPPPFCLDFSMKSSGGSSGRKEVR